jgi:predicted ester cyclase
LTGTGTERITGASHAEEAAVSAEENKLLVRRIVEGTINERNLATVDELASPDYVFHDAANPIHGPEAFKQVAGAFLTAFPDLRLTIDDQIAEGDQVLTRFGMRGTH